MVYNVVITFYSNDLGVLAHLPMRWYITCLGDTMKPSGAKLKKVYDLQKGPLDEAFLKKVKHVASTKGFRVKHLGVGDGVSLVALVPKKQNPGPHLLVVAGIHGDENAPPFGVLHYLRHVEGHTLQKANVSIIPVANPTGFRKYLRENMWGEKTNRNYFDDDKISREGKILKSKTKLLKRLGRDGVMTLHEDLDESTCYVYTTKDNDAKKLASSLLRVNIMFFRASPKYDVMLAEHDTSFEDWMERGGVPRVVVTETPAKKDFDERVRANAMLINAFVDYHIS